MSYYLNVRIMSGSRLFDAIKVFNDLKTLDFLVINNDIVDILREKLVENRIASLRKGIAPTDLDIKIPINLGLECPKGMERAEIKDILEKHDCVALLGGASRIMEEEKTSNVYIISDIRRQDLIDRMRKKYGMKIMK